MVLYDSTQPPKLHSTNSPSPPPSTPMRPLSAYEAVIVARNNQGLYNNFIVGAEYTVPLSKDRVLDALSSLCLKFPHFSLRVDDTNYNCIVSDSYTIDDSYIDVLESATPADICSKYILHKFKYGADNPLFKLVYVVDINTVFFVVDHVYFDGTAGKNFHVHLSKILEESEPTSSRFIDTSKFYDYPDPTKMMQFQDRDSKPNKPAAPSFRPPIDEKLMDCQLSIHNSTIIHLSSDETSKLLNYTKVNGTKLTSFLYAITAKKLYEILHTDSLRNTKFKTMIPINARFKIDFTQDANYKNVSEFGMFFGKYFDEIDVEHLSNTELGALSNEFQAKLLANVETAIDDFEVAETIRNTTDPLIFEKNIAGLKSRDSKPNSTLVMSNLGILNSPIINTVHFDQPMVDGSFALHFISSSSGCLALSFNSHRGVPKDIHQSYVEQVSKEIYRYCK